MHAIQQGKPALDQVYNFRTGAAVPTPQVFVEYNLWFEVEPGRFWVGADWEDARAFARAFPRLGIPAEEISGLELKDVTEQFQ